MIRLQRSNFAIWDLRFFPAQATPSFWANLKAKLWPSRLIPAWKTIVKEKKLTPKFTRHSTHDKSHALVSWKWIETKTSSTQSQKSPLQQLPKVIPFKDKLHATQWQWICKQLSRINLTRRFFSKEKVSIKRFRPFSNNDKTAFKQAQEGQTHKAIGNRCWISSIRPKQEVFHVTQLLILFTSTQKVAWWMTQARCQLADFQIQ